MHLNVCLFGFFFCLGNNKIISYHLPLKFPCAYSGVAIFLADISHDFWSIGDFTSRFKSNCLKCMKACCKENWDYSLTMGVAILLPNQAKGVNFSFSHICKFISFCADFCHC